MKKNRKHNTLKNNKKDKTMKKEKKAKKEPQENATITLAPCGLAEDILGAAALQDKEPKKEKKSKKTKKQAPPETPPPEEASALPPCGLAEDVLSPGDSPQEETKSAAAENINIEEENLLKVVTFFLDEEEYGLPITQIQEINRVVEITRVPNAPAHVRGVINLRGKVVPVIELKRRLHLGKTEIGKDSRIVLVEDGSKLLGLMVDRVAQVFNIPFDQIEDAPQEVLQVSENYVKGIGKINERMIILLELDKVIQKRGKTSS